MNEKTISMQDKLLRPAEMELESCIELLLRKMIQNGYGSGAAALKLTIELAETEYIDPETGEITAGITPTVKYKATFGVKESAGVGGSTRDDRQIIERNADGGLYFKTCEKAQKSMF